MRMTYRYPQATFPYDKLVRRNAARSKLEPEFELWDTGMLRDNRFFDITIEYAKAAPEARSSSSLPTTRPTCSCSTERQTSCRS
jgi:hypothetical protein